MRTKITRKNWNQDRWLSEVLRLPPGLSLPQAAKRLGMGYVYTCIRLRQFGYSVKETRGGFFGKRKLTPAILKHMDWTQRDADLGHKYKVSRERIRQVRKASGRNPWPDMLHHNFKVIPQVGNAHGRT